MENDVHKICVLKGDGLPYERAFLNYAGSPYRFDIVKDMDEADLICFTGGSDISPSIYGEEQNGAYGCDLVRDFRERNIITAYLGVKPLIGICRGFQLLSLSQGFKLRQHDESHQSLSSHKLENKEWVNSLHHQTVVGESKDSSSIIKSAAGDHVESFLCLKTKTGGVQWHPELMSPNTWGHKYFKALCHTLIGSRL